MSAVTVRQFASVLKVSEEQLIAQLFDAGIAVRSGEDTIGDEQKMQLLTHLRNRPGHSDLPDSNGEQPEMTAKIRVDAPARTTIEQNAFAVLGATLRDNRQRLMELAEERALVGDEDEISAARAAVTNPRTRLQAEVEWMPGTSPAKVGALLKGSRVNPAMVRDARGLNALTFANLMASALELVDPAMSADEWAGWLVTLADAEHAIETEEVLRDINEDRAVAGFPEVRDPAAVEALLTERRRHYKDIALAALNRVASGLLVDAVTKAVAKSTADGERHAPLLIDEICVAYELRAKDAIEKGAAGIGKILESIRAKAPAGARAVAPEIAQLVRSTRSWDKLAQPVQLVMKSRGQDHDASRQLAFDIRSVGIDIVNEHELMDEGRQITDLLAEVFAELPEIVERVESDVEALAGLMKQREQSEQRSAEWQREITYSAEIGAIFKDTLSISPERRPLEEPALLA